VFEIKVGDWFGGGQHEGTLAVQPEIERSAIRIVCIDGKDEDDSFCPGFHAPQFRSVSLPGGHHYNGDYDLLCKTVIESLSRDIADKPAPAS
ncbi:MAG: AcvB/VirJ family lysyl-phosphatidylglycerol hydrolase, partial [Dokdonella sp.]